MYSHYRAVTLPSPLQNHHHRATKCMFNDVQEQSDLQSSHLYNMELPEGTTYSIYLFKDSFI